MPRVDQLHILRTKAILGPVAAMARKAASSSCGTMVERVPSENADSGAPIVSSASVSYSDAVNAFLARQLLPVATS